MRRFVAAAIIVLAACGTPRSASAPSASATGSLSSPSGTVAPSPSASPQHPGIPAGNIVTIAGTGTQGDSGDGGPAIAAQLNGPKAVAVDALGNVYIGEAIGRVRKVAPDGTIRTVAGTGATGFSGDGGQATAAQLSWPISLAIDGGGSLYIADQYNFRIRKVTPDGIITTVAGIGDNQFPGNGGYSGDGGPATLARLGSPTGVALDKKGNLYIADEGNSRVRIVTADGIIRTFVGPPVPGESQHMYPAGLAFDQDGNLFIADNAALVIRKVTVDGTMTRVAGRGYPPGDSGNCTPAVSAAFGQALAVAVDGHGNIYIADAAQNKVRMVSARGIFATIAGTGVHGAFGAVGAFGDGGPATAAPLGSPPGIALDAEGNLYIADEANMRVRKVVAPWQVNHGCQ
jgi:trimeric autotransporter adhesin